MTTTTSQECNPGAALEVPALPTEQRLQGQPRVESAQVKPPLSRKAD